MSDTPIKDSLDKLGKSGDGFTFTTEKTGKDTKVGTEVSVSPGNWTLSGAWQWAKDTGNTFLGKVTWKPR